MNYDAIVVASGKGVRANLGYNKVFYQMKNGKTVLEMACQNFLDDEDCKNVIVVTDDKENVFKHPKVKVVNGGEERYNSVYNGLCACESEYVFIHDAARPFLPMSDVLKLKDVVLTTDGVILAKKASDTVHVVKDGEVQDTLDRETIYLALTPQAFRTELIKDAYGTLDLTGCTDDASVFERYNHTVKIIEGDPVNIKLTCEEDFKNL